MRGRGSDIQNLSVHALLSPLDLGEIRVPEGWEIANRALINGIEERLEIIRSMGTIPDLSDHFGTIPELAEYFGPPSTPAERVEYSALVLIQLAMAFERHLAVRP